VERARERLETRPGRSFWSGLFFWGITVLFAVSMIKEGKAAPLQLLGWILMTPTLASSVVGGAAFSQLIASRIRPQMTNDAPLIALIGGALCTTLSGLLPIIGWVVFLPIVSFMSVGSGAAGLFGGRRAAGRQAQPVMVQSPLQDASGFLLTEHQG
jgi:hypothetical protein